MKSMGMSKFHRIINALDKISITLSIWCMSYMAYTNEKYVASIIIFVFSFVFWVIILKNYKNKPWGNKVMDIFLIVMLFSGFFNDEHPLYFGAIVVTSILIDLAYFLYFDYCNIKRELLKNRQIKKN